ncbi:MAG TPA: cache domain-containing protein [Alphaproteobacteria bacterium]|nr:cache domain-containing protein [Alphaproteobacteria bacterium]
MAGKGKKTESGTRIYIAIAVLMVIVIVGLLGGILWYNFQKTTKLTIASAERLLAESSDKTVNRVKLFYEPVIAIVSLSSRVPQVVKMDADPDDQRPTLMMSGLRRYPQIFSLEVGFDNGDFEMVTRISGDERAAVRQKLGAPDQAVFAHELIGSGNNGERTTRWTFLANDGTPIEMRISDETTYDPRKRQWYTVAAQDGNVHQSDAYLFASSQEIGVTLSRRLNGSQGGVFGADLSLHEVSSFLADQKITPSSMAFIFGDDGTVMAYPDESKINKNVKNEGESILVPTKIESLGAPAIAALFEQFRQHLDGKVWMMDVGGRDYLARVSAFANPFGQREYLGMVVPVDEITRDIDEIRFDALVGSIVILLFILPLFLTIIFVWIDVRLGRKPFSLADFKKIDFDKIK